MSSPVNNGVENFKDLVDLKISILEDTLKKCDENISKIKDCSDENLILVRNVKDALNKSKLALEHIETPFYRRKSVQNSSAVFVILLLFWLLSPFVRGLEFQTWVHRNIFRTDSAVSNAFVNEMHASQDGTQTEEGLFGRISNYVKDEFGKRKLAIAAYAGGYFEYVAALESARWTSPSLSVPVFFNADVEDQVSIYVFISNWGKGVSIYEEGRNNTVDFAELFEIRGGQTREGKPVTISIDSFARKLDAFYVFDLEPSEIRPSMGNSFHRFDLALTDKGKQILTQYAENYSASNKIDYVVRYDIQLLVQIKPRGNS